MANDPNVPIYPDVNEADGYNDPGGYGQDWGRDHNAWDLDYYGTFFSSPGFATGRVLQNDLGMKSGASRFADYIQRHFANSAQSPDLENLHSLFRNRSDAELNPGDLGSMQDHHQFVRDYIGSMAGVDTGVSHLSFSDVGDIISDFVSGSGDWAMSQLYEPVMIDMQEFGSDYVGGHANQHGVLVAAINAASTTMSDMRRGAITRSLDRMYGDYLETFRNSGGNPPSGTFFDFLADRASETILGSYFGDLFGASTGSGTAQGQF